MASETNEKVLAMYRAVRELLEEGVNPEQIKVSDVTGRAGIGKGTAYEYFRSKEELIMRAINYDFRVQYEKLKGTIRESGNFRSAIYSGFDWIENCAGKKRIMAQILDMPRLKTRNEQKNVKCPAETMDRSLVREVISDMVQIGVQEGCIHDGIPRRLMELEVFGRCMQYFIFLISRTEENNDEIQETKDFIYDSMIKSLQR